MNFERAETEIVHPSGGWSCFHDRLRAGGPSRLLCGGECLLRNYSRSQDDMSDDLLAADKVRIFRKGGAAVFQSRGHLPFGAGNSYLMTIRYAGNTARVTNDVEWQPGSGLKHALQLGSAELPGRWTRYRILTLADDGRIHLADRPLDLASPLRFCPQPLAIVLENESGGLAELGLGGDLWRWQAGLNGKTEPGSLTLQRTGDGIRLLRTVAENHSGQEILPDPREYRFQAYFAWSCPDLRRQTNPDEEEDGAPAPVRLRLDAKRGADPRQLRQAGGAPRLALDLAGLPLPRQALRSIDGRPCWESKITQKFFRRIIRQLAELRTAGTLLLDGGMYPGLCCDGVHCCRKGDAWHWDIIAILDACAWMRQCLGDGWRIAVRQPDPWRMLPSLSCLGAANGFRAGPDSDGEAADDPE